jgi:hypothetical protein
MNPHPPPPSDDDLAREERELAALYRQLPRVEPDAALDARVLAEADRAVGRPARRRPQPWLVGLGSAAALVLVAGIAWHMRPMLDESRLPAMAPDGPAAAREQSAPDDRLPRVPAEAPMSAPAPALPEATPSKSASPAGAGAARPAAPFVLPEPEAAESKRDADRAPTRPRPQSIDRERARREAGPRDLPRPVLDTAPLMQPSPLPSAPAAPPAPRAPPAPPPPAGSMHGEAAGSAVVSKKVGIPQGIESLLDAAREALRQGDEATARKHVRTLLRDYPQFTLPDDLEALGPGPDAGSR